SLDEKRGPRHRRSTQASGQPYIQIVLFTVEDLSLPSKELSANCVAAHFQTT
ncbi:hypothetical protein BX616_009657, partial [Lobosporangium transversale]